MELSWDSASSCPASSSLMVHELLATAQRTTREETLRRYPQVSQSAGKLAAAMEVLVKMRDSGASLDPKAILRAVEQVVSWSEIRTAVESLRQVVAAPGEHPDAAWRGALVSRYATVSRFLPNLVATIEFEATAGAKPVLEAFQKLPALMAPGAAIDVPDRDLAVDQVATDLVPPAWRRMVSAAGCRPSRSRRGHAPTERGARKALRALRPSGAPLEFPLRNHRIDDPARQLLYGLGSHGTVLVRRDGHVALRASGRVEEPAESPHIGLCADNARLKAENRREPPTRERDLSSLSGQAAPDRGCQELPATRTRAPGHA